MAFESRTSRNGPVKPPGPPTRKNTFQKMLDLERKNKIERMRASAQDMPYRGASYQTTAPVIPPVVEKYGRVPLDARHVSPAAAQSSSQRVPVVTTIPAVLSTKNPNLTQTRQQPHNRTWSDRPGESNSIDAFLVKDSTQERAPRSNSLSAFDPRLFVSRPTVENVDSRNKTYENKYPHQLEKSPHEKNTPTTEPQSYNSSPNSSLNDDTSMSKEGRANSLSAFKILPASMTMRRQVARNPSQGIPQLDGCSDSKPVREKRSREYEEPITPDERPQTPNLNRNESNRTSICRSPSWSVTNGERGRKLDEERRGRKKAAKEAKILQEKQEKEIRLLREKQEKEQKAIREREEREREKEAKAAIKQQKKLSKPPSTPRKLTKGDRSSSMPAVPMASRISSGPKLNSFRSTDGTNDEEAPARKSFQATPALVLPGNGFIGGLKLDNARKAALGQLVDSEAKGNTAKPVFGVSERRFDLDGEDDAEYEKDMVRNAYHMALTDRPSSLSSSAETLIQNKSRRQTIGSEPPTNVSQPQDLMQLLGKPKSPFYQLPPANNSFVEEIFHTIQKNASQSSSLLSQAHPLRSNPSYDFRPSTHRVSDESLKPDRMSVTRGSREDGKQDESAYDASSFASRMAKKSGSFVSVSPKAQENSSKQAEPRTTYGDHISSLISPESIKCLRPDRLAAVLAAEAPNALVQNGRRHQVKVLESVNTKSHSMLIERLSMVEAEEADQEEAEEPAPVVLEPKREPSKTRGSRSSSRDWFRRSVKEESKPTIQERRRSRSMKRDSQISKAMSFNSSEKSEASQVEGTPKAEKARSVRRNSISPTLNNFKAAAKAAFSKYGPAAPSSQANLPSSPLNANQTGSADGNASINTANSARRQTLPSSVTMPSMAKADRFLGGKFSSVPVNSRRPSTEHVFASKSSSVTTKGSDEEVSSSPEDVEDTSNITTPTASRPTSKKEHLLTLKPPSSSTLPGGRFREEFSPGFLSALDRGNFELSPASNDGSIQASPVQEISSIQHTPSASPIEPEIQAKSKVETKASVSASASGIPSKAEDGASLIADAIARVEKFTLSEEKGESKPPAVVVDTTKKEEKSDETTITSHNNENNITVNKTSLIINKGLGHLTRQPSIKSASTSHLPDLKTVVSSSTTPGSKEINGNAKPKEIDFSFLPPLKHESLTRPPRALAATTASPSLQAIASSLLGPTSSKIATRPGSLLPSPSFSPSGALPELSKARGSGIRHSSLPPMRDRRARDDEGVVGAGVSPPSIKASWLAAISADKSVPNSTSTKDLSTSTSTSSTLSTTTPKPQSITNLVSSSVSLMKSQKPSSFPSLSPSPSSTSQISLATIGPAVPFQLTSNVLKHPTGGALEDPYAKCFFVCCSCKRFHDLPVAVYQVLLRKGMSEKLGGGDRGVEGLVKGGGKEKGKEVKGTDVAKEEEVVRCQWCNHEMGAACCENWAVCVKLMERLG